MLFRSILPSHYYVIVLSTPSASPNLETASFVFPNSFRSPKEECEVSSASHFHHQFNKYQAYKINIFSLIS